MRSLTAFMIGSVCSGLGYSADGYFGFWVGLLCGLSIVWTDMVLEVLEDDRT